MKTKVILISFIFALLVVGILGFGYIDHTTSRTCPVSSFYGADCPSSVDSFALVSHHISGLQHVTQFIVSPESSFAVLLALVLSLMLLVFVKKIQNFLITNTMRLFCQKCIDILDLVTLSINRFLRWLVLHNKRDSDALLTVYCMT